MAQRALFDDIMCGRLLWCSNGQSRNASVAVGLVAGGQRSAICGRAGVQGRTLYAR